MAFGDLFPSIDEAKNIIGSGWIIHNIFEF